MDDHEHLAEHLEDVCEGQEGDVRVVVAAVHLDAEREAGFLYIVHLLQVDSSALRPGLG